MSEELPAVTLARIEGKLDLLHASITAAETRGADHEARIRSLEGRPVGITPAKFLSTVVGFGSLAAALSAVVTLLSR
jgi:hypothetical protein